MRVLLVACAILALTAAREADDIEIEMAFDKLLEDEGIEISDEEYEYRLGGFALNYLAAEDDDPINLDMIYDADELVKQNGAKLIPTLKSELEEELAKRSVDPFDMGGQATPPGFDGRYYKRKIIINPANHQGVCGNCYLHTFVAALELAYTRASGKKVKFSEQEMTDCYNNGCEGGDFRMVAVTMGYLDKLSSVANYGPYKSKQLTCRADTTPDSLAAVKVEGFIDVPANKVEEAIILYGSVMTCMKWGSSPGDACYMSNYKAKQVVDYPAVEGGCDHAVLIVGYNSDHWLVRNSHGKDWGEYGYFRIKRGINSCGIEQNMAVVVVSTRSGSKGVAANGCPNDKPNFCASTSTCTSGSACAKAISLLELEERDDEIVDADADFDFLDETEEIVDEEEEIVEEEVVEEVVEEVLADEEIIAVEERQARIPGKVQKREVRVPGERVKRDEEEKRVRGSGKSNIGKREEEEKRKNRNLNEDGKSWVPGRLARLLLKRGLMSEEDLIDYFENDDVVEVEERCADKSPQCKVMKARGMDVCSGRMLPHCLSTCGKCGSAPAPAPKDNGEIQGKCITPSIPNGQVSNGKYMNPGDKLNVRCRPGFVLAGGISKCLIQDVFTNDDKDGRLHPECIKIVGGALSGNGATYAGDKNTYSMMGRAMECDSWNKDVLRGILVDYKEGNELLLGNHNYCRNPGGIEPVPFCLGSATGLGTINYCFGHPGCDTCAGATDKYGPEFCQQASNTRYCLYTNKQSANRVASIQESCPATCCALAGC